MKKKVLVTGCTGLVGHGICLSLLSKGYEIWGTSRSKIKSNHPFFHPVVLDLENESSIGDLTKTLDEVDIVIHNAAIIPGINKYSFEKYLKINFTATIELINKSIETGIKQFIYISGSPFSFQKETNYEINEDSKYLPKNDYGVSKALSEINCLKHMNEDQILLCVFRFTAPYGYINKSKAVFSTFINNVKNDKPITLWGNGSRTQTFTFVEDIGEACSVSIEKKAKGIYTITGPEKISMKNLAKKVIEAFPSSKSKIIFENKIDPQEGFSVSISTQRATKELGFVPQNDLSKGISKIAKADDSIHFFK
jgi:nucleoside-diphosphate-sugar epimerase